MYNRLQEKVQERGGLNSKFGLRIYNFKYIILYSNKIC